MSKPGHNKPPKDQPKDPAQAQDLIASFIDRHRRLASEIAELQEDVKDLNNEIKSSGLNAAQIKTVLAELKFIEDKGRDAYSAKQAELDIYRRAGGVTLGDGE